MKRPSLQFYPADWRNNAKLRRCSFAERGVWIDVICLLHDSDEYGVLRWPLKDIALAVGCKLSELKSLVLKGVVKGDDTKAEALIYIPRHAGKDGEPVILIAGDTGPIWYSSRMVRDEYVRSKAGASTRFKSNSPDTTPPARFKPSQRQGEPPSQREGHGASSSTSSSTSVQSSVRAAEIVTALRLLNVKGASPSHPVVLEWEALNVTDEHLKIAVETARRDRGKGEAPFSFTYLRGIVTDMLLPREAKQGTAWWSTDALMLAKATELGISTVGLSSEQLKQRISDAIGQKKRAA